MFAEALTSALTIAPVAIEVVKVTFPDFWDSDWYYFNECKRAEELGLHIIVLKPRRRGYSYKNAAKCAWTYTFSKTRANSLILAEDKKYSEETMRMAVSYLDFLNRHTGFSRQRQHINKLPKVRKNFKSPTRRDQGDSDFIVPDTREGWVALLAKTLKAAFLADKKNTFTFSTQLIRGKGAPIKGFGGVCHRV